MARRRRQRPKGRRRRGRVQGTMFDQLSTARGVHNSARFARRIRKSGHLGLF